MSSAPFENQQDLSQDPGHGAGAQGGGPQYNADPYRTSGHEAPKPGPGIYKSPAVATMLSLMPGLGQAYVGYYQQGFTNILVVAATITLLSSDRIRGLEPFLGVFLAFFWIFNMIDAARRAHHYNRSAAGLGGESVPEDFKLPGTGGSLLGGAVLVVLGVLFLLDLNFDVSLAWIENWWPALLVIFGANLIYKARQKAK
jgi:hypothetical protein